MPERKFKGFHIDCEEVQGEGAYLRLARPSYKQIKWAQQSAREEEMDSFETALKVVASLALEWNWVDDAGKKLPLTEEAIFGLPLQEQNFLIQEFNKLNQDKEKN